jgi:DNA-binding NtrC family response regulator
MLKTVLIVETDQAVRWLVSTRLRLAGLAIRDASNGPQGVSIFAAQKDEIIGIVSGELSDAFDGASLLDAVRQIAPTIPVFFFLGHSLPEGIHRPGVEVFLKPAGLGALCRAVANLAGTAALNPEMVAPAI